ncbi:hypothetical protein O181_109930 [Austropuccinia psidii MF-1]|uniref:Uncharacterized protein n=1 Tax=Austropuccinia psidii MF-1 TaxID=1389203 RepID=A0A9Q3PR10_9BASI|nr:hypothetical protein [Austropuccinia psidii MF-1]
MNLVNTKDNNSCFIQNIDIYLLFSGLDIFPPKKYDLFNDPDAWNVSIFTLDATISMQNIPKSHQPLFQLAQSLFVPTFHKKMFWENLILQSISVSAQDLIQPEKFEITNSTEDDPLLVQQLSLEFLVSCLSTRPSHSAQIKNTLDEKEENQRIPH